MSTPKIGLTVVPAPPIGHVLDAPPVLKASEHSVDYTWDDAARLCCTPK